MAFLVQDYHDLVQLLADHPEWRTELRRLLLSDEVLALPAIVRELAEAQRRTEASLAQLAADVRALTGEVQKLADGQRRAGYRAVPLVAGKQITAEALASARAQTVGVVQDGQGVLADEALATWLT